MPERYELTALWTSWIRSGLFDGGEAPEAASPTDLANWARVAADLELASWEPIIVEYRAHVSALARSEDSAKVRAAVNHMTACFDRGWAGARDIADQVNAAINSFEWNRWRDDSTKQYTRDMVERSYGDRNWSAARNADLGRRRAALHS